MLRMELKEKNKLDDLRSATDKLFRMWQKMDIPTKMESDYSGIDLLYMN